MKGVKKSADATCSASLLGQAPGNTVRLSECVRVYSLGTVCHTGPGIVHDRCVGTMSVAIAGVGSAGVCWWGAVAGVPVRVPVCASATGWPGRCGVPLAVVVNSPGSTDPWPFRVRCSSIVHWRWPNPIPAGS